MGNKNKSIFLLVVILVIVAVGAAIYFGYPYLRGRETAKKQEDLITRMTQFKVMDTTIDETTIDRYRVEFNNRRDFFLQHQGQKTAFDVLLKMGLIKQLIHDYTGAEEIWTYLYKIEPKSYVLNGDLAYLYQYYLSDYQKAEEFYLKALEPKDVVNRYLYLNGLYELYHYRLKDDAKTQVVLDRAMTELPEDINVFLMAADYYRETGNKDKARELYNKALKINPVSIVAKAGLEKLKNQ